MTVKFTFKYRYLAKKYIYFSGCVLMEKAKEDYSVKFKDY